VARINELFDRVDASHPKKHARAGATDETDPRPTSQAPSPWKILAGAWILVVATGLMLLPCSSILQALGARVEFHDPRLLATLLTVTLLGHPCRRMGPLGIILYVLAIAGLPSAWSGLNDSAARSLSVFLLSMA